MSINKANKIIDRIYACSLILLSAFIVFAVPGKMYAFSSSGIAGVSFNFQDSGSETGIIPNDPQYGDSYRMADVGDVNSDGYNDLAIGVPGEFYSGHNGYGGEAYLLYGSADGFTNINLANAVRFAVGPDTGDALGVTVAGLGDINDDGFDDLAITASGTLNQSRVNILFGQSSQFFSPRY